MCHPAQLINMNPASREFIFYFSSFFYEAKLHGEWISNDLRQLCCAMQILSALPLFCGFISRIFHEIQHKKNHHFLTFADKQTWMYSLSHYILAVPNHLFVTKKNPLVFWISRDLWWKRFLFPFNFISNKVENIFLINIFFSSLKKTNYFFMLQPHNFFSISWSKDSGVGSIYNLDGQTVNNKALQGFFILLIYKKLGGQLPSHVKPLHTT